MKLRDYYYAILLPRKMHRFANVNFFELADRTEQATWSVLAASFGFLFSLLASKVKSFGKTGGQSFKRITLVNLKNLRQKGLMTLPAQ